MKRALTRKFILSAGLFSLVALSAVLIWQCARQRSLLEQQRTGMAALQLEISRISEQLADADRTRSELTDDLQRLENERQSLQDRASNLTAQRDHLRAEVDQKTTQAESLAQHVATIQQELAETKHQNLQLEALPDELEDKLASAHRQVEMLEEEMDRQAAIASALPPSFSLAGISSDTSVFALEGSLDDPSSLPMKVVLVNVDGLILEGWINRPLGGQLLGHAGKWHQPASALVKGQKVFMLPSKSHEMRH